MHRSKAIENERSIAVDNVLAHSSKSFNSIMLKGISDQCFICPMRFNSILLKCFETYLDFGQ